MRSARDSAPDPSRASGSVCLPLSPRPRLLRVPGCLAKVVRYNPGLDASLHGVGAGRHPEACHLPHGPACFATHLLESGYDIRAVLEGLGHKAITTPRISAHVLTRGGLAARSPVDVL